MVKVSVVVPVYNVEPFVERCLDSLVKQTLKEMEIIIVNDGSTDNSSQICKKYSQKFSNIKYLSQKNQGLSAARNTGIKAAEGEFIGFVDSDDFVEKTMFELLYHNAMENHCEISCCGHASYFEDGTTKLNTKQRIHKRFSKEEALDLFLLQEYFDVIACNKIYKTNLFQDIRYPVGMLYEDILTTYRLIDKSTYVFLDSNTQYYYFQRADSIAHNVFNEKTMGILKAVQGFMNFSRERYPQNRNIYLGEIRWYLVVINKMFAADCEDKKINSALKKKIGKNIFRILFSKYLPGIRKLQMFLFYISVPLYKKMYSKVKQR